MISSSRALIPSQSPRWVRSSDGMVAGVCEGIAKAAGVDPWLVRIGWLVAVLAFGTGLLAYAVLWLALPRADRAYEADRKRILGVCSWIAKKTGLEAGVVRALAIFLAIPSFGTSILLYFILALFAASDGSTSSSEIVV